MGKLEKQIKKLLKSLAKLAVKKKKAKKRKAAKKTKKNLMADFAQAQLLNKLRDAPSATTGTSSLVAQDAKRKVEELQEQHKHKTDSKLEKLENNSNALAVDSHRLWNNLENIQRQMEQDRVNAGRRGIEHDPIYFLEHKKDNVNEQIEVLEEHIGELMQHIQDIPADEKETHPLVDEYEAELAKAQMKLQQEEQEKTEVERELRMAKEAKKQRDKENKARKQAYDAEYNARVAERPKREAKPSVRLQD
jgi:hypothetical protein